MKKTTIKLLSNLVSEYDSVIKVMEHDAKRSMEEDGRAYGGFVRMAKGKMQEYITDKIVNITWSTELEQIPDRLSINSEKIKIPIKREYVEKIENRQIRDYIIKNISDYNYGLSVDKHVFVDNKFCIGIECKAYSENAMIKRILVDFMLLKSKFPDLQCFLFQLESQLGGDYSSAEENPFGSHPTHSIMSYFPTVNLEIVTLLRGERKVDQPINKKEFFKEIRVEELSIAVSRLSNAFKIIGATNP